MVLLRAAAMVVSAGDGVDDEREAAEDVPGVAVEVVGGEIGVQAGEQLVLDAAQGADAGAAVHGEDDAVVEAGVGRAVAQEAEQGADGEVADGLADDLDGELGEAGERVDGALDLLLALVA